MELKIFHDINYGALQPRCTVQLKINASIKARLSKMPTSIEESEQWITDSIKGYETIIFPPTPSSIPESTFVSKKYTAIIPDAIPTELPITPPDNTPHERFYSAVIRWEGYRLKETLIRDANCLRDDDMTIDAVKSVLKYLKRVSSDAAEILEKKIHPDLSTDFDGIEEYDRAANATRNIYRFLYQYACKLYYEVATIFSCILSDEDIITVRDYYNDELGFFTKNYQLEVFVDAITIIHTAQKELFDGTYNITTLKILYQFIGKCDSISSLFPVISEYENSLYCQSKEIDDEFDFISIKKEIQSRLNALDNGRDALDLINDEIEVIESLGIISSNSTSIPVKLHSYLKKQQELYEKNIASMFSTSVQPDTKKIKVKPKQTGLTLPQMKRIVHDTLHFMSANTHTGKKIMSDEDFKIMTDTVIEFIRDGGIIPQNITRVTTNLSNEYVCYSFYLLYKSMKHFGRQNWIDLMQALFVQMDTWTSTAYKRFSQVPQYYYQDIKPNK